MRRLVLPVLILVAAALLPALLLRPGPAAGLATSPAWCKPAGHHACQDPATARCKRPGRHACPTPTPTPTTPAPTPTGTATPTPAPTSTPAGTGTPCVTSADDGFCPGPGQDYLYPPDTLSDGTSTYIANNVWNHAALPSATQTLTVTDPGNWQADADMAAGNTAVISAPQVRQDLTTPAGPAPLSTWADITASTTEDQHPNPGTSAEAGYDVWGGLAGQPSTSFTHEMMIWTDTINRGTCGGATPVASGVPFGGTGGVPARTWDLCVNGPQTPASEYIWWLPGTQQPSGAVDLLAMVRWLASHGYYPPGTGLDQIDQTFEICSTGGQPETFAVTGFTLTAT